MPSLVITTRDKNSRKINVDAGVSLMQALRDNGVDDILALCGGCCSCATCHVFIEDEAVLAKLPPMSGYENDLLDGSTHRQPNSRLSCQLPTAELPDGLHVTVAPED
jgi:ferredoxin